MQRPETTVNTKSQLRGGKKSGVLAKRFKFLDAGICEGGSLLGFRSPWGLRTLQPACRGQILALPLANRGTLGESALCLKFPICKWG